MSETDRWRAEAERRALEILSRDVLDRCQCESCVSLLMPSLLSLCATVEQATLEEMRQLVGLAWDEGVRFASEILRSQVVPQSEAREACIDRVCALAQAGDIPAAPPAGEEQA